MNDIAPQKWLIIILGSLFTAVIAWASLANIDQVVRAPGTIEPAGEIHKIQSRFPGEISEVRIELGQLVDKGEVLFVLEPEDNVQNTDKLEDRLFRTQAQVDRLTAQLDARNTIPFQNDIPERIRSTEQLALFSEQTELSLELDSIDSKRAEIEILIREAQVQQAHFNSLIDITQSEIAIIKPLVQDGLEPKLRLTQLERQLANNMHQFNESQISEDRARQQLRALDLQSKQIKTEYAIRVQTELRDALANLNEIENDYEAARGRLSQTQVKAPVRGLISKIADVTPGAVYRGGDLLAELVPSSDGYVANIRLPTKERPNVEIGQTVRVSLDAYDFTTHGHISGNLLKIADNTTITETETYYEAVIELGELTTSKSGVNIRPTPGMILQAEIMGDKRTVLEYILGPILRARSQALTE
jgi:HlyD family type I secretion membrane fusion protein